MGNFESLFFRSFFLQKIRIILLNAVLTSKESLKNPVLKKIEEEKGENSKNLLLMYVKVKLGIKRIVLLNAKIFAFSTFFNKYEQVAKKVD